MANTLDSTILDSLVEGYQAKILAEKQRLQQAENVKVESARNIDRLEGAILGIKEAAKIVAGESNHGLVVKKPELEKVKKPIIEIHMSNIYLSLIHI